MDQVGQEVKRMREERGWSQAKLAVAADMSVSGVSQIENGKRNLSTTTLVKLARALEIDVADLFPKAQAPLSFEDLADEEDRLEEVQRERRARTFKAVFASAEERIVHIEFVARLYANYAEEGLSDARDLEKTGKLTYGLGIRWELLRKSLSDSVINSGLDDYAARVEYGEEPVSEKERTAVHAFTDGLLKMWNIVDRVRKAEYGNHTAAGVAGEYEPESTIRTFEDTLRPVRPELKLLHSEQARNIA